VTNAVLHPRYDAHGASAQIKLRVARTQHTIRIEVSDRDARPLPPPREFMSAEETGRGLALVAELATSWGSHPASVGDGKVVWAEVNVSGNS